MFRFGLTETQINNLYADLALWIYKVLEPEFFFETLNWRQPLGIDRYFLNF